MQEPHRRTASPQVGVLRPLSCLDASRLAPPPPPNKEDIYVYRHIFITPPPNIIWSDVDATGISCQNVNQKKFLDEFTFVFQKEVGSFLQVLRLF